MKRVCVATIILTQPCLMIAGQVNVHVNGLENLNLTDWEFVNHPHNFIYPDTLKIDTTHSGKVIYGIASYYTYPFHGRKTANGERYNMYEQTVAHKSLPFNTWVKITNLNNGLSTFARVNDRGPYWEDRIIDLSYAVAEDLGMVEVGIQKVKVEIISRTMNWY